MSGVRILVVVFLLLVVIPWPVGAQSGGPGETASTPPFQEHIVAPGETLFSIARRYGTTVDAIAHASGIADPSQIFVGQRLVIPGALGPVDAWTAHIVRPGETLTGIARQYGLDRRTLALANHLVNPTLLTAGQVVRIPTGRKEAAGALHAVQPGETLFHVAFRYGVSFWDLLAANWTDRPPVALSGQWLLVPGARPTGMPSPFIQIDVSPIPARQGDTLTVVVHTEKPVALDGRLFDRAVPFAEENGVYYAYIGVHAFTEPGLYEMTLTATADGETAAVTVAVQVEDGGYGHERIDVPPSRARLLDAAVIAAEQQRLKEVRALFTPQRYWHGPFRLPVEAAISSYFGTRRSYNGGPYNSYHEGVDFDIGAGAPVYAPADGMVVLAEPLAVRGTRWS